VPFVTFRGYCFLIEKEKVTSSHTVRWCDMYRCIGVDIVDVIDVAYLYQLDLMDEGC